MWGIGFGLEHIGMAALRRPILFSLLTLALIVAAATQLLHLKFEGDITVVLPDDSAAIRDFKTQKSEFRDFARDVTILVQSDRLISASGLEDLRSLQLELAVTDGVDNVVSIFSLPNPDPQTGEIGSFFPDPIPDDETAKKRAAELLAEYPQADSLLAIERNTAVVLATLSEWDDISRPGPYSALKKAAEAARPKDFKLSFTGLTPISVTIVTALVADQMRLTLIGLLLGAGNRLSGVPQTLGSADLRGSAGTDGNLGAGDVRRDRTAGQLLYHCTADTGADPGLCRRHHALLPLAFDQCGFARSAR